ncbi:MAG: AbrB/MazE/SpoVT family DNA-binding domain-containing protein [Nitrososphaerota archaeon]|nr:AbrB/MazE/SpoVT family DNA-binding domain-containing protein [Nitrososphaerota archaeon]
MPVEFEVKVQKIGSSLEAVIPKPLADGYKIKKGDVLVWVADGPTITVRKRV